jgi:hypothetical protein
MFFPDVLNRIFVKGDPDRVRAVFDYIRGRPGENELFDLNAIIPMPECIQITAEMEGLGIIIEMYGQEEMDAYRERCAAAKRRCLVETGYPGWCEWAISQWDTPRNVYQVERWEDSSDTLFFCSAGWSPFSPLLELSHTFPDVVIILDYADESGCLGRAVFAAGDGSNEQYPDNSDAGEDIWEALKDFAGRNNEDYSLRFDEEDEWPSVIYVD